MWDWPAKESVTRKPWVQPSLLLDGGVHDFVLVFLAYMTMPAECHFGKVSALYFYFLIQSYCKKKIDGGGGKMVS